VGIAATGFCYPGGIFQLFHRQDQQIFHQQDQQIFHRQDQQVFHRQDQQISRLPTAAVRSLLAGLSASTPSTSSATSRLIHQRQRFVQSAGTRLKFWTESIRQITT
jgi:hypothetical protein